MVITTEIWKEMIIIMDTDTMMNHLIKIVNKPDLIEEDKDINMTKTNIIEMIVLKK